MSKLPVNNILVAGAALTTAALTAAYFSASRQKPAEPDQIVPETQHEMSHNILIGDVGGTNVRLQLVRLFHEDHSCERALTLKDLTVFNPQAEKSFVDCVNKFLVGVPDEDKPSIGVVGIAGAVVNNTVSAVNISHWGTTDGNDIAMTLGMKKMIFINDFIAAAYGVATLTDYDVKSIDGSPVEKQEGPCSIKLIMGPGTGLGAGLLVKGPEFDSLYHPFPTEGGHTDMCIRTQEDFDLRQFALEYIETSENIENKRGKRKTDRVSVESVCAGPAIPLIYSFMKKQYPDLKTELESGGEDRQPKAFEQIVSKDIISFAMESKDPLCMKVVEKFTEILANEVGNSALKTMPYGGIYLIGGVIHGIFDHLVSSP